MYNGLLTRAVFTLFKMIKNTPAQPISTYLNKLLNAHPIQKTATLILSICYFIIKRNLERV